MLKLTITRTWAPVTKTVTECQECPWFVRVNDGQSTLSVCQHPKYNGGKGGYDAVLGDELLISDLCPERPRKRKLFVGDDDHDPDHKWEITVPA